MSFCKLGDLVEVVYSSCGNKGRKGKITGSEVVEGIPKWIVSGVFHGYDDSVHDHGLFMDMDLRPLNDVEASPSTQEVTA